MRPPTRRDLDKIDKRIEYLEALEYPSLDEEQELLLFEGLLKATRVVSNDIRRVKQRVDVQAKRLIEINKILQNLETERSGDRKMKLMQELVAEGKAISQEMANIERTWSEIMKQMAPQILWWLMMVVGVVGVFLGAAHFTVSLTGLAREQTELLQVVSNMNDKWVGVVDRAMGMTESVGGAFSGIGSGIKSLASALFGGMVRIGTPKVALEGYQTGAHLLRIADKQNYHWPLPLYQDGDGKSVIRAADVRRLFPHEHRLFRKDVSGHCRISHYSLLQRLCRFRQANRRAPPWTRNPKTTAWAEKARGVKPPTALS